ncbi:MAG: ABC transporter permease [Candidatus Aminicenantes bacterium]|nr:ABC transporter permease [Candidatus Aminicenantes bacterium]
MKKNLPPRFGQKLFSLFLPLPERKYFSEGIGEVFEMKAKEKGRIRALLWYWKEIVFSIHLVLFTNLLWSVTMFHNYLKIVFRLIKRKKLFSFVNILGLTIGLTSSFLILLYMNFELSYDKFHENADNIYRVYMHQPGNLVSGSSTDLWVTTPPILKPTWEQELPEIEKIANINFFDVVFRKDETLLDETVLFADPEFLDIFTFPLLYGDPKTALDEPFSLLITERTAAKYFGKENPVGKIVPTSGEHQYKITGVLRNIPENSHLKFDYLGSFNTLYTIFDRNWETTNWLNNGLDTYLTLRADAGSEQFDEKLRKYDVQGFGSKMWSFHVQPLKDIHFNRATRGQGDIRYIYIFSAIGLFILLIACFNFINLSTARSATRIKEVGVRKVVGAYRRQLADQLLGESFLFALIALLFSLISVMAILPAFNALIGKELSISTFLNFKFMLGIIGITLLVGIISGSFPAIFISSFQPVRILKGHFKISSKGSLRFRNVLVVIQFALSIIMIVSTITLYNQLHYIRNKKLGYEKNHILTFRTRGINRLVLKQDLLEKPEISKVSFSSGLPTRIGWSNIPAWKGKDPNDNPFFYRLSVDYEFFDTYGLEMVKGRSFSQELGDRGNAYILNEAAVKHLGFEEPIGQPFGFWKITGTVVGVVKDFHFESLHKPITPLGIGILDSQNFGHVSVKISSQNINSTINHIKKTWEKLSPRYPFEFSFIDQRVDEMYQTEQKMAESFNYFALIAIFIACLGLFGLASFITEQKTKEIGIRKILGATAPKIISLLTKEFFLLLALANLMAWPLAWWGMNRWLKSFAYRIDLSVISFILAAVIVYLIAMVSVSSQFVRATRVNPADSLRYE